MLTIGLILSLAAGMYVVVWLLRASHANRPWSEAVCPACSTPCEQRSLLLPGMSRDVKCAGCGSDFTIQVVDVMSERMREREAAMGGINRPASSSSEPIVQPVYTPIAPPPPPPLPPPQPLPATSAAVHSSIAKAIAVASAANEWGIVAVLAQQLASRATHGFDESTHGQRGGTMRGPHHAGRPGARVVVPLVSDRDVDASAGARHDSAAITQDDHVEDRPLARPQRPTAGE